MDTDAPRPRRDDSAVLARGASVGRYLVLALVGKGGMGEVYAAYDPELDRKIALKLLRAQGAAGADASEGRARLLREAQAIARLSDPNVVVVYDVGTFEDRVFLAMEFVDGNTVGYWLEAEARSWRDIVKTFAQAGRGLAAAHRAGLVHRDFKPDNVMIGRDGKIRVMDFGLARAIEETGEVRAAGLDAGLPARVTGERAVVARVTPASASAAVRTPLSSAAVSPGAGVASASGGGAGAWTDEDTCTRDLSPEAAQAQSPVPHSPIGSPLTVTGTMMGTPAYMAPEQFQARGLDARTDQFSFCAALYEALYGERPFEGKSILELSTNVCAGRLRSAPPRTRVPGWLRRVVVRGLRSDPLQRHGSMEALLEALTSDPARARNRWLAAASVAGLVAVLGGGLLRAQRQQKMRCLGGEAKLAGIWEPPTAEGGLSPRKEAIRRAFMATGKRYAADSFEVVKNALDRYVVDWTTMHRDACEATNMRGEQSAEVLDLRMECLNERLSGVSALAAIFSESDGDVVTRAPQAAQALRPVEHCADLVALRAVVPPPENPEVRRQVVDVQTQLTDVKAMTDAGRYAQVRPYLPRLVQSARATKYSPLLADALFRSAELEFLTGDPAKAETLYEETVWLAEASRSDELAAAAAAQLISAVGYAQPRFREAERWARHADAILARLGPGQDVIAGWRWNNLALVYEREGMAENMLEALARALAFKISALGGRHVDVALTHINVGNALAQLDRHQEALEANGQALAIFEASIGSQHPFCGVALSNRAVYFNALGRHREAQNAAERAIEIGEREGSTEALTLALPLTALGWSLIEQKKSGDAIPHLQRSLALNEGKAEEKGSIGETQFALARALVDTAGPPERIIALVKSATANLQGNDVAKWAARLRAWAGTAGAQLQVSMR